MARIVLTAFLVLFLAGGAFAQDGGYNFENTSEGIIKRLLPPPQPEPAPVPETTVPQTRGVESGGWSNAFDAAPAGKTRSFAPAPPREEKNEQVVKTRAIKVYHKQGNKEVWTTVVSPEHRTGQFLNLAVEFDVASYALRSTSMALLSELGKALADPRLAEQTVYINGHTDSDGSEDYNLRLSYNRAESVKQFLVSNYGISPDRLLVRGYGEGMPLVSNDSRANKQTNRRVEIVATQEAF